MDFPAITSLKDHFLIAMPNLREGFFAKSITYICDHSSQGAIGIVINQPSRLTLYDILKNLSIECTGKDKFIQVMVGGPVSMNQGFVLHRNFQKHWKSTIDISKEISFTSSNDILPSIASGNGPEDFLICLGYAGWSSGQLESEISENSWLILSASSHIIFDTEIEQRFSLAVEALGIDINLISDKGGHA